MTRSVTSFQQIGMALIFFLFFEHNLFLFDCFQNFLREDMLGQGEEKQIVDGYERMTCFQPEHQIRFIIYSNYFLFLPIA